MTDRDMLKKLLKQAQDKYFELCFEYARDSEGKTIESFEDFCADYILANGVIVPPCKVGDKVYFIDTCTTAEDFGKKYVSWDNVLQLSFNCFGEWVLLTDKRIVDIGEVFLTKEEAEAKLKEC